MEVNKSKIFTEEIDNNDTTVMVVRNGVGWTCRISNQERRNRHQCIYLRDQLRLHWMNYDMHRARKDEWTEDEYSYITRK